MKRVARSATPAEIPLSVIQSEAKNLEYIHFKLRNVTEILRR